MTKSLSSSKQNRNIDRLIEIIREHSRTLETKHVVAGFDGFVDTIARIIKSKKKNNTRNYFRSKKEFAKYILEKGSSSFGLELEEITTKIGGNMPIMSNVLGTLGMQVKCFGTLGHPEIHPVFSLLSQHCQLYSFANPGLSTACEFNDGKMLIAQMKELSSIGWNDLVSVIGLDTLASAYRESDLVCMVNWSEIEKSTEIWNGILHQIVMQEPMPKNDRVIFFDLADCSRRSKDEIQQALDLINEFSINGRVVLGLNENESGEIHNTIFNKKHEKKLRDRGQKIFDKMNINCLLLHSSKEAVLINKGGVFVSNSFHIKHPNVSTGAGDHFNAGFCAALMLNVEPELSLLLAHTLSGSFVESGVSPGWEQLIQFLNNKLSGKK
jgi:hypothetical protein